MKYLLFILLLISTIHAKTYKFSGGEGNTVQLVSAKILQSAYKKANIQMEPVFLQLEESLQYSNSGLTDGELSRIKNISDIYPNLVIVPVPLITVTAVAFSKKKNIKITKWGDLKNYDFTIVKGTKFIEKATKDINKTLSTSFKNAFKDLQTGKTEIVVVPKLSGLKVNVENAYNDIHIVSNALKSLKLYHFVNKKNTHLIPIITPILRTMKDSGEFEYWRKSYLNGIKQDNI